MRSIQRYQDRLSMLSMNRIISQFIVAILQVWRAVTRVRRATAKKFLQIHTHQGERNRLMGDLSYFEFLPYSPIFPKNFMFLVRKNANGCGADRRRFLNFDYFYAFSRQFSFTFSHFVGGHGPHGPPPLATPLVASDLKSQSLEFSSCWINRKLRAMGCAACHLGAYHYVNCADPSAVKLNQFSE